MAVTTVTPSPVPSAVLCGHDGVFAIAAILANGARGRIRLLLLGSPLVTMRRLPVEQKPRGRDTHFGPLSTWSLLMGGRASVLIAGTGGDSGFVRAGRHSVGVSGTGVNTSSHTGRAPCSSRSSASTKPSARVQHHHAAGVESFCGCPRSALPLTAASQPTRTWSADIAIGTQRTTRGGRVSCSGSTARRQALRAHQSACTCGRSRFKPLRPAGRAHAARRSTSRRPAMLRHRQQGQVGSQRLPSGSRRARGAESRSRASRTARSRDMNRRGIPSQA